MPSSRAPHIQARLYVALSDHVPHVDLPLQQRADIVLNNVVETSLAHDAEDADFVLAVAGVREVGFCRCGHFCRT